MKAVLILATAFIFISMLMNGARRRGTLTEQANRAVTGRANAMRWFVYGLLVFVAVVCVAVAWQTFQAPH